MILQIKINGQTASLSTRRKVKKAGPLFELIYPKFGFRTMKNEVLLRSKTTGWFGWLPKDEIIIKELKEEQ